MILKSESFKKLFVSWFHNYNCSWSYDTHFKNHIKIPFQWSWIELHIHARGNCYTGTNHFCTLEHVNEYWCHTSIQELWTSSGFYHFPLVTWKENNSYYKRFRQSQVTLRFYSIRKLGSLQSAWKTNVCLTLIKEYDWIMIWKCH